MERQRNEESPASLCNLGCYNLKEKDCHREECIARRDDL